MRTSLPLVVGYPRTGFTLLISVIAEIEKYDQPIRPVRQVLKAFCDTGGVQISARIEAVFQRRGLSGDLLYNGNFRQMAGGPKWLKGDNDEVACFRKYIGIRGKGDFTLITSHPREVMDYYEIIHSHVGPRQWSEHPGYARHRRFASIRNPAGTLASACFSLNALASEYIQRFVPPKKDDDLMRQHLALYKLSDINFFEGLLGPFKRYLEEFSDCAEQYHVMRWEDLILQPVETIDGIARTMGITLPAGAAADIWRRLGHMNLTGAHKHNYRRGHGVVGGWRRWLTNTHLDMMRDYGLDAFGVQFGYGLIGSLDETAYTPFQQTLASAIGRGEVLREYEDEDLFGYAFNKSNLDFDRFGFKRYGWKRHTQVERSSCTDDGLVMEVWDVAEAACEAVNQALNGWLKKGRHGSISEKRFAIETMAAQVRPLFSDAAALDVWRCGMQDAVEREEQSRQALAQISNRAPAGMCRPDPVLLRSIGTINIVEYDTRYYALPQALGPVDFHIQDAAALPGVRVASSLSAILAEVAIL